MKYKTDKPETIHAITTLEAFFDFHDRNYPLKDVEDLIYYALHHKHYKGRSPYSIVFFKEELQKLINACLQLEQEYDLQEFFQVPAGEKGYPNLEQRKDFMLHISFMPWPYTPKHISVQQYLNPIKAFRQLRKYKTKTDWIKTLDDLLEYALSNESIHGCIPSYNVLKIRKILLQLIEAAYLIFVRNREQDEVAG